MATFPALKPSTRTFTPGRHPHSEIPTMSGLQTRVRTSNVLLDQRLRLSFTALTEAEMLSIRSHYIGQQGRFLSFTIPSDLLSGTTTPASFTPTGYSWVYASRPAITDVGIQHYDVSLELATVPPEGANVNGAEFTIGVSITTVTPMVQSITIAFSPGVSGVESAGLDLTVTASLAEGAASGS